MPHPSYPNPLLGCVWRRLQLPLKRSRGCSWLQRYTRGQGSLSADSTGGSGGSGNTAVPPAIRCTLCVWRSTSAPLCPSRSFHLCAGPVPFAVRFCVFVLTLLLLLLYFLVHHRRPAVQRQRQALADGQQEEAHGGGDRREGSSTQHAEFVNNPVGRPLVFGAGLSCKYPSGI